MFYVILPFALYVLFGLWLPYTLITNGNVVLGILWGTVFNLSAMYFFWMYGKKR